MAELGALRTRISLDSAQFERSMAGVNRQLKSLQQEQKAVTSSGTGFARGVDELRSKSDVLTRTLELQQAKVAELRRRYEESRKATGENSKETQNAEIAYNRAVAEMNKTENALKGITAEIERQTNPWNVLGQNMDEAGRKMQSFGSKATDIGRTMTTRVTMPIVGIGAAALTAGLNFEEGMSKVQAISGATGSDLEALEEMAKEMGETTRFSATEAAEGMTFLAMAGFEVNEILDAMPGLLDLAASSGMDLGRAADIASNILSGFGMEAGEAGRVADVLAKGASTANTNVEQLGGAMKYVAPVAASLGLDVEGLTAAVGFMSDAGIQGEQAGRQLRQGLLRLASPTGAAASLIEELGINAFNADGSMKSLDEVVAELQEGLGDMDDKARAAALSTLFGAESVAGWTTLIERGSDELAEYTKELQNSEGAASEMAATMEDNGKGAIREFRSALEGAGIAVSEHLLPAFTGIVEKGTEVVRKFGELDDSTQENIIKMAGFAAVIGPTVMAVGSLTNSIGGILRVGGSFFSLLGRAGGTGLLGRIGLMGATGGPVGLAIAGVGLLGGVIYGLTKDSEELHEINLDVAQSLSDQHTEISEAANRYEELRKQSQLTTQEFGELLDIRQEMAKNPEEDALKELEERYNELVEKSGMTNEELDEMIQHNQTIVDNAPQTAEAHSKQGNAIAGVNDELKAYLDTLRETSLQELEMERLKFEENKLVHLERINEAKEREKEINEQMLMLSDLQKLSDEEKEARLWEIVDAQSHYLTSEEEAVELAKEEEVLRQMLNDGVVSTIENLQSQLQEQQEIITNAETELEKGKEIDNLYAEIHLKKLGINETGQEGIKLAEEQLGKLRDEKAELEKILETQGDYNGETSEQIRLKEEQIREHERILRLLTDETGLTSDLVSDEQKRENQIRHVNDVLSAQERQLRDNTSEARELTEELGKDVEKNVNVDDKGTAQKIHETATRSATKSVTLSAVWSGVTSGLSAALRNFRFPGFAKGTSHHPGGLSWIGEEGFELVRAGNNWAALDFGVYNLPRGTQVFTHDESKRIINALNRLPAYATGASPSGEANRIISQLNNPVIQSDTGDIVVEVPVILEGREVARGTYRYVREFNEQEERHGLRARGLPV